MLAKHGFDYIFSQSYFRILTSYLSDDKECSVFQIVFEVQIEPDMSLFFSRFDCGFEILPKCLKQINLSSLQ